MRSEQVLLPDTNSPIVIIFYATYHVFVEVVWMR
jgi:hypothetical protein